MKIPNRRWCSWLGYLALVAAALGAVAFYQARGQSGYPLDDSWIHLGFARNLAAGQGFGLNPHEPTPGATSPLWVVLLAVGYLLGAGHSVWPWLLGGIVLGIAGILASVLIATCSRLIPDAGGEKTTSWHKWLGGLVVVWSAPLVWSAAGAMEVPLFVATLLAAQLAFLHSDRESLRGDLRWGALAGVSALARPEGLLLAMILAAAALLGPGRAGWKRAVAGLLACAVVYSPSVVFCLATNGRIFPNTFYAKTIEVLAAPDPSYLLQAARFCLTASPGVAILLLIGLAAAVVNLRDRRRLEILLAVGGFVLALPAAYAILDRHVFFGFAGNLNRYLYPPLGAAVVLGVWGISWGTGHLQRGLARSAGAILLVAALFLTGYDSVRRADLFARNVNDINSMQVASARAVARALPPGSLVAANDVGALSYFGDCRVLDLVGIVSVPTMQALAGRPPTQEAHERAVFPLLQRTRPEAIVVFPSWFPRTLQRLEAGLDIIAVHEDPANTTSGGTKLVACRIDWERVGQH